MNLRGSIYLGLRYLKRHRGKAVLLITAISLSIFLPLAILLVVHKAEIHLRSRADSTPLLLGAPGSPLELVFNGLYYSKPRIARITLGDAQKLSEKRMAEAIPIYARYQARDHRIVGTSLDYFRFRNLRIKEGTLMTRLGDCVLGSEAAKELNLGPGESIISTPEQMFDIAGVYPLKMRITGVLDSTGGADDRAIFADLKTTWIIEGIAHGHQDAKPGDDTVLESDGNNVALNASVVEYNEITPDNVDSFHFHGDPSEFPITAAIILPKDIKSERILLGRYQEGQSGPQLIRPSKVMADLFDTVFQVRNLVIAALIAIGTASAMIAGLVFVLSNRLRAREFESLANIGAAPGSVRLLVGFEAAFVALVSVVLVAVLLSLLAFLIPVILPRLTG